MMLELISYKMDLPDNVDMKMMREAPSSHLNPLDLSTSSKTESASSTVPDYLPSPTLRDFASPEQQIAVDPHFLQEAKQRLGFPTDLPYPNNRTPPSSVVTHPVDDVPTGKDSTDSDSQRNGLDRVGSISGKRPDYQNLLFPESRPPPLGVGYDSMLGGSVGSVGSPPVSMSPMLSSLYDSPTGQTSVSPSPFGLGLTGMSAYVMNRKRRQEAREKDKEKEKKDKDLSNTQAAPATVTSEQTSSSSLGDSDDSDAKKGKIMPDEKKDDAYWERRRKNNEAAKRSRDARRQKEEEIAMRAAYLEQENLKLRAQVAILKNETAKLHYLLYNSRV